jgi:hypothetical protein
MPIPSVYKTPATQCPSGSRAPPNHPHDFRKSLRQHPCRVGHRISRRRRAGLSGRRDSRLHRDATGRLPERNRRAWRGSVRRAETANRDCPRAGPATTGADLQRSDEQSRQRDSRTTGYNDRAAGGARDGDHDHASGAGVVGGKARGATGMKDAVSARTYG